MQAKTLGRVPDFGAVDIVVDGSSVEAAASPERLLDALALLAHEYGHALIGRLRAVEDTTLVAPVGRMQTLDEAAVDLAVQAADEYRCDAFASQVIGGVATAQIDGEGPAPATIWTIRGDLYFYELIEALDQIHRGWPDLVQSYREGHIGLEDLLQRLVQRTREVIVLLAHADAHAVAVGKPPIDHLRRIAPAGCHALPARRMGSDPRRARRSRHPHPIA